ncbi:MAG: NUDIX hydrolase [Candidatus Aenigmarchaeota archaeon]|nr:NUDIX hydrolase [Candidatus Aenigmarchaeota archaeon]
MAGRRIATHDTTCIVVRKDGKLLLVQRKHRPETGYWALPGGHRERDESIRRCAEREAQEEIGPAAVNPRPFFTFTHDIDIGHRHRCHVFHGRLAGRPRAGSDAAAAKFVALPVMRRLELTHYTKLIINRMLEHGLL